MEPRFCLAGSSVCVLKAQEQLVEAHRKKEAVLIAAASAPPRFCGHGCLTGLPQADFEKAKDGLKQEHRRQMAGLEKTIEKKVARDFSCVA